MVGQAVSELGGLDVLINNAGIQISRHSDELSSADFDKVLAVNLRGAFLCAREAIRHFLAEGKPGVIINVSSVHQLIPKPDYLGYSVSKGGMQNLTRTLALEYAGRGIRVNGIGPGATVTPINRAWIDDPVKREQVESHIPMAPGRHRRGDGRGGVLPGQRRRRVHHRSDDLRRRRADAVPELPRALVLGMTRHLRDPLGKLALIDDAKRASALAEVRHGRMYDLGHVLDEHVPVFPGRYFKQTLVTTAHHANPGRRRGRERGQLDHRAGVGDDAARHPSRRALAPADGRPWLRRLHRRGARRHSRRHAAWGSRPCRRSSRRAGWSTSAASGPAR